MNWFSQFVQRVQTETPVFFKKVIAFGVTLGAIGAGLITLPSFDVKLPVDLHIIGGYCVAIGAVAAIIAKSTTTDANLKQ